MSKRRPSPLEWLHQGGSKDKKHALWAHPCVATTLHHLLVYATLRFTHDVVVQLEACADEAMTGQRHMTATICFVYSVFMFLIRLVTSPTKTAVVYELMWLCNTTLLFSSWAFWTNRPVVAMSACIVVGIDQLLWYVDLGVFLLRRKFPIGVCRYLTWPETSWAAKLTCTHHLWTLPLLLSATRGLIRQAIPLSVIFMIVHVTWSRLVTPVSIQGSGTTVKYLNINLSHELWKDISLSFLQISKGDPPVHVYLFRLLWRWQVFNLMVYLALSWATRIVFGSGAFALSTC